MLDSTGSPPIVLYRHKNDTVIQFHSHIDTCILNEQSTVLALVVIIVPGSQCSVGDNERPIIQKNVRGTYKGPASSHMYPTDYKWRQER